MTNLSNDQIAEICRFAQDSSSRGAGLSIRDLIQRCQYRDLRDHLTEEQLRQHVAAHPELIDQWSMYSGDKRTSGGWYFLREGGDWVVGRLDGATKRSDENRYAFPEVACAAYIIKELDFWASLSRGVPVRSPPPR
jgi:hypothetical protein